MIATTEDKVPVRPPSPPFRDRAARYSARFAAGTKDDPTKVTEEERQAHQGISAKVAEEFNEFASDAYENGWSTHFHYTPFAPNESLQTAQTLFENRLAFLAGFKPGMKVLDVGCGIGAPARELAKFFGCEVVGVSISQRQLDRAIELTAQEGLTHLCTFVRANFLNLPFSPHSFDAAYAIDATCHSPEYVMVYSQISKVLKPGAPFALSEWVMTPGYNPTDPKHIRMRNRIERGNGITNLQTSSVAHQDLLSAGFEICHEEDYCDHWLNTLRFNPDLSNTRSEEDYYPISPVQVPFTTGSRLADPPVRPCRLEPDDLSQQTRAWYYPLLGQSKLAANTTDYWTAWRMKPAYRKIMYDLLYFLEKILHVYPKGSCEAMNTIGLTVDSVTEAGIEGVFSPCWWYICRKVREPKIRPEWLPVATGICEGLENGAGGDRVGNTARS